MKRDLANNTFLDGLVMDLNPMVTPNTMLTNALNATLLTYNGNENVLLNDMGNGRVETAYLPEGFIPVGTTSFGGIVYIASYNPLTGQSLIGSFPSPERNITSDELKESDKTLKRDNFYLGDYILNPQYKLILLDKELHSGDKFLISSDTLKDIKDYLSAYNSNYFNINEFPRYLKLHIISVDDFGKISYLDDNIVWYEDNGNYYIQLKNIQNTDKNDIDEYRDLITSNYSVFNTKGKLGILAELECIDTFQSSYSAFVEDNSDTNFTSTKKYSFDLSTLLNKNLLIQKQASLTFNFNWTYENDNKFSKNYVNLNGVKIISSDFDDNFNNNDLLELNIKHTLISKIREINISNSDLCNGVIYRNKSLYDLLNNNYFFKNNTSERNSNLINSDDKEEIYQNLLDLNLIRKNDGTDKEVSINPILIKYYIVNPSYLEILKEDSEKENLLEKINLFNNENQITFEIIPKMPFGYLKYLSNKITINLNKLGSGEISLNEWRYYINKDNLNLNWGLDAYPEEGKEINLITFDFYKLTQEVLNSFSGVGSEDLKDYFDTSEYTLFNPLDDITSDFGFNEEKISFAGSFSKLIEFKDKFEKNQCYIVRIKINYGDKNISTNRYYYRILYTFPIFNNHYFSIDDFKELTLNKEYFEYKLHNEDTNIFQNNSFYYYDSYALGEDGKESENLVDDRKNFSLNTRFVENKNITYKNLRQQNDIIAEGFKTYILKLKEYDNFKSNQLFTKFDFDNNYDIKSEDYTIYTDAGHPNIIKEITESKFTENSKIIYSDFFKELSPISVEFPVPPTENITYNVKLLNNTSTYIGLDTNIYPSTGGNIDKTEDWGGGNSNSSGNYSPGYNTDGSHYYEQEEFPEKTEYKYPAKLRIWIGDHSKQSDSSIDLYVVNNSNFITIQLPKSDIIINSPFICDFTEDYINYNYELNPLVYNTSEGIIEVFLTDEKAKLTNNNIVLIEADNKKTVTLDVLDSGTIRTWLNSEMENCAFKKFSFKVTKNDVTSAFIIKLNNNKCITGKSDQEQIDDHIEDVRYKILKNDNLGEILFIKAYNKIYGLITNYKRDGATISVVSNLDSINNLYIWEESTNGKNVYKIYNVVWRDNYIINIPISLNSDLRPMLKSFKINDVEISNNPKNRYPNNLYIESIPILENPSINILVRINTEDINKLLNTSGIYYYNTITGEIESSANISKLYKKEGEKSVIVSSFDIGHITFNPSVKDGNLYIDRDNATDSLKGNVYFFAEYTKEKDNWMNFVSGAGQMAVLTNIFIPRTS